MATYIELRAISRGQQVRIGNTKVSRDITTAVDIDNAQVRRDLERHLALGAVVVVSGAKSGYGAGGFWVESGAVTDEGVSATDLAIRVTAGTLRKSDGTTQAITAATPSVGAADVTNPRIDNVVVTNSSGVVSIVAGTASTTPTAPAVTTTTTKLAEVYVAANVTAITNANISDKRVNVAKAL